jgi:UDPglucose 6-dehydrogenase
MLSEDLYYGSEVMRDRDAFLERADLIVSNRLEEALLPHRHKVFTRDLFGLS